MKYALIGCGRIARKHLRAALDNSLEISAVCDVLPKRTADLLAEDEVQKDGIAQYADYQRMLEEIKPELVSIATESGKHAEIALDCIDRGIHVIIEKPMAMNLRDADEIILRSRKKGVKVAACHQNRFNIAVQRMRDALEAGRFGKLSHGSVHVRWNRDHHYYDQAAWRGTWAQDGGALMNQCIHGIDLLRWMMGDEVESVSAQIRRQFHDYLECEDLGMAVVTFRNGAIGTIEGTTNVYPRNLEETLYLFGERGTVKLGGTSTNKIDVWEFADEREGDQANKGFTELTSNVYGNGHTSLFADMIEAIEQDRSPYVDALAGRNAVEMVLAIYQSAATGNPVKFPLEKADSRNFSGMFEKQDRQRRIAL